MLPLRCQTPLTYRLGPVVLSNTQLPKRHNQQQLKYHSPRGDHLDAKIRSLQPEASPTDLEKDYIQRTSHHKSIGIPKVVSRSVLCITINDKTQRFDAKN